MTVELHLTRGLPASGKTTFAKAWVAEDPDTRARLNRDDLRAMIHPVYSQYPTESAVTIAQHNAANGLLRKGISVIVDDTNLRAHHVRDWLKLAERAGATVVFHDEFMDVPLDDCITRNSLRGVMGESRTVPTEVIRDMHDKFLARGPLPIPELPTKTVSFAPPRYVGDPSLPKAFIIDLDGTLALNLQGRPWYEYSRVGEDSVNAPIRDIAQALMLDGYEMIIFSGREDYCLDDTVDWLERHGLDGYAAIGMRASKDNRKDAIIKTELFATVRDEYNVRFVLDDRDQVVNMWRDLGLTCLQVAPGNF